MCLLFYIIEADTSLPGAAYIPQRDTDNMSQGVNTDDGGPIAQQASFYMWRDIEGEGLVPKREEACSELSTAQKKFLGCGYGLFSLQRVSAMREHGGINLEEFKQVPDKYVKTNGVLEVVQLQTDGANGILKHMVDSRLFRTDVTDAAGNTATHIAAKEGNAEAIEILAEAYDANVDQLNTLGQTALRIAIDSKNVKAVEALIKAGANVNLEDSDGKRPLNYATTDPENIEIESILRAAGASFPPSDRSPLYPVNQFS